jgi:hypothetical protein
MKVLGQLFREFGVPFAVAIAWTVYNVHWGPKPAGGWSIGPVINLFGPTFFFAAWMVGQWFRVRKQQRVEQGLGGIETKVQHMLDALDAKTTDLVSHITGGKSSPYLIVSPGADNALSQVRVGVLGNHSLRDVRVRIVDSAFDPQTAIGATFDIGIIPFRHVHRLPASALDVRQSDNGRLIIFFSALNGSMFQFLDFRRADGKWRFATRVLAHGELVHQQIDEGFGSQPDWAVETRRIGVTLEHETPESLRAKGIDDDFTGWTRA